MVSKLTFKKKLALELFRKFKSNSKKLHQLDYIFWECTLKCNLSCLHCGSDCKKNSNLPDMPLKDFIDAIDSLFGNINPNKTMIVLTGGEPLLRKDLEICGKLLYERGFPWGFVTNGLKLTAERLNSLLKSGLRAVTISLDGLETSHNWLRNNVESFDKALNAIRFLSAIKDIRYDVVTCVNKKNFDELPQLLDLLLKIRVKEWRIFTIFAIGRAKENHELQLSPVQFKQLFEFIVKTRKEGKIKLNYGCEGFLGNYEGEVRDNLFFCRAGISIASVLADGSISACPSIRENFIQGNIYKDNFRNIWEIRYEKFRNRAWMKTGKCNECGYFRYCEGNGMHLRDEMTGEILFCHLQRIIEGETY